MKKFAAIALTLALTASAACAGATTVGICQLVQHEALDAATQGFKDALTGGSAMTSALFQVSPVNTFILCVAMRILMGWFVGLLFSLLRRVDKKGGWSYFAGALSAPLLNTLFFMGYIVLAFYHTDYVQSLVLAKGASNPLMFVILLTGMQGLVEAIVCSVAGTAIGSALLKVTGRMNGHR